MGLEGDHQEVVVALRLLVEVEEEEVAVMLRLKKEVAHSEAEGGQLWFPLSDHDDGDGGGGGWGWWTSGVEAVGCWLQGEVAAEGWSFVLDEKTGRMIMDKNIQAKKTLNNKFILIIYTSGINTDV